MATKIFVNLPVRDLKRSVAFFAGLGYAFDARFTDDTAACMVIAISPACRSRAGKALALGATEARDPMDFGFMYARSFDDLHGHIWEILHMDQSAIPPG